MGDPSTYHSLSVGYNKFFIDKRYINLKPCGDGSYGFVASAYDITTGIEYREKIVHREDNSESVVKYTLLR